MATEPAGKKPPSARQRPARKAPAAKAKAKPRPRAKAGSTGRSMKGLTEPELELRRTLTFRLHAERRMPFRRIVDALAAGVTAPNGQIVKFEASVSTVREDYWLVMRRDGYVPAPDDVDAHREAQLEQCERMKAGLVDQAFGRAATVDADGGPVPAMPADPRAVTAYLRVLDHEAKLAGIYRQPDVATAPQVNPASTALSQLLETDADFRRQLADGVLARYGAMSSALAN